MTSQGDCSGRFSGQFQLSVIGQRITSVLLKVILLDCLEIKLSHLLLCLDARAFAVCWPGVPTWQNSSSSRSLEPSFCDFFQTFKGFVWFYMNPRGKGLWLVLCCRKLVRETRCDRQCTAYLFCGSEIHNTNILSNKDKTFSIYIL